MICQRTRLPRLKLVEIIIMRHMGYNYDDIAREVNYSPSHAGYLYNFTERRKLNKEVQYLRAVAESMVRMMIARLNAGILSGV